MIYRRPPPVLDLTPDGRIRPTPGVPFAARVIGVAVAVAVLCTLLSVAALAIWVASLLIPVALVAALIAWVAFKLHRWQGGRGRGPARPITVRWPPR